jgi:hypothetical protein
MMPKCVSCEFAMVMPSSCNHLYYCDEDKIKGEDYGHPIKLSQKACSHYKPLVVDCNFKIKIKLYYKRYYAIDEAGDVIASASYRDIAVTKAYKYIRGTFLLEKKQLDLF